MWEGLSKNRYEHIHVRFSPAIHGLRRFLDSPSHMVRSDNARISFKMAYQTQPRCVTAQRQLHRTQKLPAECTKVSNSSGCGVGPSENVRSHGWRSPSVTWMCRDRKSTRLNSSHVRISYAVFCLKKK